MDKAGPNVMGLFFCVWLASESHFWLALFFSLSQLSLSTAYFAIRYVLFLQQGSHGRAQGQFLCKGLYLQTIVDLNIVRTIGIIRATAEGMTTKGGGKAQ